MSAMRKRARVLPYYLLMYFAGCTGEATGSLEGYVVGKNPSTQKRQPVMKGRIRLFAGDRVYSADIDEGRFKVSDVLAGEVRITVESPAFASEPLDGRNAPRWFQIPQKFSRVDATPLSWNVVPGLQAVLVSLADGTVTEKRTDY